MPACKIKIHGRVVSDPKAELQEAGGMDPGETNNCLPGISLLHVDVAPDPCAAFAVMTCLCAVCLMCVSHATLFIHLERGNVFFSRGSVTNAKHSSWCRIDAQ